MLCFRCLFSSTYYKTIITTCRKKVHSSFQTTNLSFLPPANEVCEGYVFTPVCYSVHRGGCLRQCMLRHAHGQTPPWVETPGQTSLGQTLYGRHPLPRSDTGMHPNGMHFCFEIILKCSRGLMEAMTK